MSFGLNRDLNQNFTNSWFQNRILYKEKKKNYDNTQTTTTTKKDTQFSIVLFALVFIRKKNFLD